VPVCFVYEGGLATPFLDNDDETPLSQEEVQELAEKLRKED
jgi:hypothetical protein